jgi:hypothetical protein
MTPQQQAAASPFSIDAARAWRRRRELTIAQMAQRLIEAGAVSDRLAASDCLLGHGYGRHVAILLDQAISTAELALVATAMQEPPMRPTAAFPLIDGSLSSPPSSDGFTAAKVETMTQDLIAYAAFDDEHAAIRTLSGRGHGHGDIVRLVDRAMARARALHAERATRISR